MTVLTWDEVGDRLYETGVDRGVIYLPGGQAVPWNGLVSVGEALSRESKSYFLDGIKYLERHIPGPYSGKLQAFTYPDELEDLLGNSQIVAGVRLHVQQDSMFTLSYRTKIGNDLEGEDYGYKIHILYHVMANPSDHTNNSLGGAPSIQPFEWTLSGTPEEAYGVWTNHFSVDSRTAAPELLAALEVLLYGTEEAEPNIPAGVTEFMDWVFAFGDEV